MQPPTPDELVSPSAPTSGSTSVPDPGPPSTAAAWLPFAAVVGLATMLAASGALPRWSGLVHAVAPPPLDLAFDLRVLVARAPSYGVLVGGVAGSLVIRSIVLASILEALGDTRSLGSRFRSALRFYLLLLFPLGAAAGLEFSGYAAVYAWYAWSGLGLTALVMFRALPLASGRRRAAPLWAYAALVGLGALARAGGGAAPVALIPVAGVLTVVGMRRRHRRRADAAAAVPISLAVMLAASPIASAQPVGPRAALLLVPGVDTSSGFGAMYGFRPSRIGFVDCTRVFYFSYRGPGAGAPSGEAACPLRLHEPYRKQDTQRSLGELVEAFALQVERIRTETGGLPLIVVTHSQGAVIAWSAIASGRAAGVTDLVALAGYPHSPVGYPRPGRDGAGRIGADALRLLSRAFNGVGTGTFSPDAPLARDVLARPDGLESVFAEPLPEGVRAATVSSTFDVIAAPEGLAVRGVPGRTVDATHVGLVDADESYAAISAALFGTPIPARSRLAGILDAVLPAWMPPPAHV